MAHSIQSRWSLCALALALPLFGGCASQKLLEEREVEIVGLRQKMTDLKKENRDLKGLLQTYEVQLDEANVLLMERQNEPAPRYDDLANLGVDVTGRNGNIVFTVPNEISFASGSAKLTNNGRAALLAVAETLNRDFPSAYYWIEGHTDSDPIKKSAFESNRDLSLARAMAVLHYMVEECQVDDDSCIVAGHGEYMPIADNSTAAGKAQNRRVELIVKN